MIQELNSLKCDASNYELMFMEFDIPKIEKEKQDTPIDARPEEIGNKFGVTVKKQEIELELAEENINLQEVVAKFLNDNVKEIEEYPKFYGLDSDLTETEFQRKLISKLIMVGNYIANNGRIGMPQVIICNEKTFEKYLNNEMAVTSLNDMKIVVNNYINENEFYLMRHNDLRHSGYAFLYHINDNDELLYKIVTISNFAHKQAAKLVIY